MRTLGPRLVSRQVRDVEVRSRALRQPLAVDFARRLTGRTIAGARRRAKYLLFDLGDSESWIVHLGMSGRVLHVADADGYVFVKHDHVLVALDDGSACVFHDPRRFGQMLIADAATVPLLAHIGPEPLDPGAFDADYLIALRRRTRRTIKDVLMDQRVVAGLGNIYVNEILFTAGIRPMRRLARMTHTECGRVVDATRIVLAEAIEHRGTSIADFLDGIGRKGGYQWRRRVYDRDGEPCSRCGAQIKCVVVGQRSSFYCPRCQR